MKKIGQIMRIGVHKESVPAKAIKWDQKSIFYAFQRVIREEYGNQGIKNFKPDFWKDGKLFVRADSSVWASELQLKKNELKKKINQELGAEEIREIRAKQGN